jgi:hypothetical protein
MFKNFECEEPVDFEVLVGTEGTSAHTASYLIGKGKRYIECISILLGYWTSPRIEREALRYALAWNGRSRLAIQFDRAHLHYLGWVSAATEHVVNNPVDPWSKSLEMIRLVFEGLLDDARARVEFIQRWAADMRLSGKFEEVARVLVAQEQEQIVREVAATLVRVSDRVDNVATLIGELKSKRPELEQVPKDALARIGQRALELIERGSAGSATGDKGRLQSLVAGTAADAMLKALLSGVPNER